jgi:SAM-dependent methyltransferase
MRNDRRPRKPGPARRFPDSRGRRPASAAADTAWDHVAQWYDRLVGDEGSDYHRAVILPAALQRLELAPGQRVLDLCCGQGVLVRLLEREPLRFILGIDASPQLIAAARQRGLQRSILHAYRDVAQGPAGPAGPPAEVRFEVGDALQPGPWADGSFDRVACVMAAHDVADYGALARTAAASLRPGGKLALVLMHPCFRIPRQSSWGWDEARKIQYRRIDRYASPMEIPIQTAPGRDPGAHTRFFHRPLAEYVNALGAAGLAVTAMEEPGTHRRSDPGGRSRGENRAAGEIPVFLALTATRLA